MISCRKKTASTKKHMPLNCAFAVVREFCSGLLINFKGDVYIEDQC